MKSKVEKQATSNAGASFDAAKLSEPTEPASSSHSRLPVLPAASATGMEYDPSSDQNYVSESPYSDDECDVDLEEIEEMLLQIERDQKRERDEDPFDNLPEMEYIIANEWDI